MNIYSKFIVGILMMIGAVGSAYAAKITLEYADDDARSALLMIYNVTQRKSITERNVFEVADGDNIRLTFNTKDFDVDINGKNIVAAASKDYTPWETGPITEDLTVHVSVSDRQYGQTLVKIAVLDPDGIVVRTESLDGPIFDLSTLTPAKSGDMYIYDIPVSLKYPKVFVYPAPGYWVKSSYTGEGDDRVETIMSTNNGLILHVENYMLNADKKIVYRLMCGNSGSFKGSPSNALLVDNNGNVFDAVEGYNVYDVDISYVTPLKIRPNGVKSDGSVSYSVYLNGNMMDMDDETGTYILNVSGDAVIYAFVGRTAAVKRTVTVEKPADDNISTIVYDKVVKADLSKESFKVFNGAEVVVKPAPGMDVFVDDVRMTPENGTVTLSANKNMSVKIADSGLSGISSIVNEYDTYNVVTIDGMELLKNASKTEVDALPKGFYIINGKKVIK